MIYFTSFGQLCIILSTRFSLQWKIYSRTSHDRLQHSSWNKRWKFENYLMLVVNFSFPFHSIRIMLFCRLCYRVIPLLCGGEIYFPKAEVMWCLEPNLSFLKLLSVLLDWVRAKRSKINLDTGPQVVLNKSRTFDLRK